MNQEYYLVWQDWGHGMFVVSVCNFDCIESMVHLSWNSFKSGYPDYVFQENIGRLTKNNDDEYTLNIRWKRTGQWSDSGMNCYRIKKIQINTLLDGIHASD